MDNTFKETKHVIIQFEGWQVDLFINENDNLGMTIEKECNGVVRDIFVHKDKLKVNWI